ncbi:hypothetical protein V8C44DRAFT_360278 [Trichoderma aethiopicum]
MSVVQVLVRMGELWSAEGTTLPLLFLLLLLSRRPQRAMDWGRSGFVAAVVAGVSGASTVHPKPGQGPDPAEDRRDAGRDGHIGDSHTRSTREARSPQHRQQLSS